ncbi:MAG: hypothetical protein A3I09_02305 [Deltaproteobacteria bacterium RIFCSPLOWO2_02_FULL_47_10]|nr:MAG: hypothetical protein A3I09_02305 [Deltaproteobacteria bacterium RIFCSPLOWO2_02_FULL_47_10]
MIYPLATSLFNRLQVLPLKQPLGSPPKIKALIKQKNSPRHLANSLALRSAGVVRRYPSSVSLSRVSRLNKLSLFSAFPPVVAVTFNAIIFASILVLLKVKPIFIILSRGKKKGYKIKRGIYSK